MYLACCVVPNGDIVKSLCVVKVWTILVCVCGGKEGGCI